MMASLDLMKQRYEAMLGRPVIGKDEFIADIRASVRDGSGYAAGKIGNSEKHCLYLPIADPRFSDRVRRSAFALALRRHAQIMGLFPVDRESALTFNAEFYVPAVRQLDCLGLFLEQPAIETTLIRSYDITSKLIHFVDQEPDRSVPDSPEDCYLPLLTGRRVLLVCPFARLLAERATQATFEAVWRKTGKRWFHPAAIDAVEFPYAIEPETQARYGTLQALFDDIAADIATRRFDIALIAAGLLGIPLAAFVKRLGKAGISLGGHLQVLFGVIGNRWRERPDWHTTYFTDAWIDMPARYVPRTAAECDDGAYW